MKAHLILAAIIALLILCACSAGITESQAGAVARTFVSKQVKLFVKENQTVKTNVTNTALYVQDIQNSADGWLVVINATGTVDDIERSSLLTVGVNSKGIVTELNGNKLTPVKTSRT